MKIPDYLIPEFSSKNDFAVNKNFAVDSKIAWVCKTSSLHEWVAPLSSRVYAKTGCPICSNRKIIPGVNDLDTLYPNIVANSWSTNNILSPKTLHPGSSKKAFWICDLGHEYETAIKNKINGSKCPYCANKKLLPGFNDLATTHPELLSLWDYEKNKIVPSRCSKGQDLAVWWKCLQGHSWQSPISNIVRGRRCPFCTMKQIIPGEKDLATTHPHLINEWFDERDIRTVSYGSDYKATWICPRSHKWEAVVYSRTREEKPSGCPYCDGKKRVIQGERDLAYMYPLIAKEFSSKNLFKANQVSAHSDKRAIWKCKKGHEWTASINSRTGNRKSGCPQCSSSVSRMETEIADYVKSLVGIDSVLTSVRNVISPKELDIYIPSKKIAIEFNGLYWHTESAGKDRHYHRSKWGACREQGIQLIQVWEDEWKNKPEIVKRLLAHKLGVSQEPRVYGRNTSVHVIKKSEAKEFLEQYHIQGFASGTYYLGLKTKDDVTVAVMVLKRYQNELYLDRYATNQQVVGGQSKILSWVDKNVDFDQLVTFADVQVSNGNLYERTGWVEDRVLRPDYRYVVQGMRVHKFNYRLKRFRDDPELLWEEGLSESQLAILNDLPRVWDSGKIRYVRKRR